MFLVINVLQVFVFDSFQIPFYITVIIFMLAVATSITLVLKKKKWL